MIPTEHNYSHFASQLPEPYVGDMFRQQLQDGLEEDVVSAGKGTSKPLSADELVD